MRAATKEAKTPYKRLEIGRCAHVLLGGGKGEGVGKDDDFVPKMFWEDVRSTLLQHGFYEVEAKGKRKLFVRKDYKLNLCLTEPPDKSKPMPKSTVNKVRKWVGLARWFDEVEFVEMLNNASADFMDRLFELFDR